MQENLISIIVPVYNAEKYISNCIEAILRQTHQNFEIILVNDGSKDNSGNICRKYEKEHENITLINKDNGGAADARNTGIDYAKGSIICFVDADDHIHEQYLEILYNNLQIYDCDISMCQFQITHTQKPSYDLKSTECRVLTNKEALHLCCSINKTAVTSPCLKLYRKKLFEHIRYPVGRTYEDLATTHKIIYKAEKIVITNLKLYSYYMSPESVMRKRYSVLNFRSENMAQDERLDFYKQIGDLELYEKLVISVQRNRIANYCKACKYLKNYKEDKRKLLKKYRCTKPEVIWEYCSFKDKILFICFNIIRPICVYILFPIYEKKQRALWNTEKIS